MPDAPYPALSPCDSASPNRHAGVMNKTSVPSIDSIDRQWFLVDAENQTLGRLATEVASVLRGKNKPSFTPHLDTGDFVVVVNADKIRVSGNKANQKLYRRHSGRPGGMKVETFQALQDRLPERIVEKAIKGMLPHNALGRQLFRKLKVYRGPEHPHSAQRPQTLQLNPAASSQ
ncbi:LSU ribosomal protein L13p (L13Ae) [Prochlorococcus sp. MIT 0702]|nr:LSU ribosomal protein L13p (L13Ae) [Prochlorococcus sp. MIT 0702]